MEGKIVFPLMALLVFVSGCVGNETVESQKSFASKVYLIQSPTCPHCKAIIKYLDSVDFNVSIIKTTSGEYGKYLKKYNFSWNGGVPLLFAILENNTLIAIQGYPTESQEKNGYFIGKEYEMNMCNSLDGKMTFKNGEYQFCKLPNGVILGNKYAVDYLLELCEKNLCKEINL